MTRCVSASAPGTAASENAGKTIVLDEGADLTVAGSHAGAVAVHGGREAGEARIASAAQVPLEILGPEDGRLPGGCPADELPCGRARRGGQRAPRCSIWLITSTPRRARWGRSWRLPAYGSTRPTSRRCVRTNCRRAQATLVKSQGVASLVVAGFTRKSILAAVEAGDMSQLVEAPQAPPPGISGRETATATTREDATGPGQRPPQAGVPQNLPGVVAKNLPNAKPFTAPPMPSLPNGARG